MTFPAPIVLFIYNRPLHTRRTLEMLAACTLAAASDLIIYADGAKGEGDRENVNAARRVARAVQGFKSVSMIERSRNLGLAESIISGVTEICRSHGRVIVIEDDLVVAPELLQFLNCGLERYEKEQRVLQVSGYAYPAHDALAPDTFFLPMVSCWGWATWDRAWQKFDRSMSLLMAFDRDSELRCRFNVDDAYDYYTMACNQRDGRINSWGICWQMSLFANEGLVLYPRQSLVMNAGFDGSGTHKMTRPGFQRSLDRQPINFANLQWPIGVETNLSAYSDLKRLLIKSKPGVVRRFAQWLRA